MFSGSGIKYIVIGLIVLSLVGSIVGGVVYLNKKWYNEGYDAAIAKVTLEIEKEKARQAAIVDRINEAHERDIQQLEQQNALLEDRLKKIFEEAAKEPTRNDTGLPSTSVRRLNQIR